MIIYNQVRLTRNMKKNPVISTKKERELNELRRRISGCKKCVIGKTRKNIVFGEGPSDAMIMVVGQAPGAKEDETGRPFIGRAGKLLTYLLGLAGIKREETYITSVLKSFPPKNRKPAKEEVECCMPYLKKQIEIINPEKIILLGEVAFSAFFPGEKLSDFRGKWAKKDGRSYFPTYHPAAGLRFVKMKKVIEKDMRKIKKSSKNEKGSAK